VKELSWHGKVMGKTIVKINNHHHQELESVHW